MTNPQNPIPQNPLPPLGVRQAHFKDEAETNKELRDIIPQLIIVYALLDAQKQGIPADERVCQEEALNVSAEMKKLFPEMVPIIGDQMPPPPEEVKNHADITRQNLEMAKKITTFMQKLQGLLLPDQNTKS